MARRVVVLGLMLWTACGLFDGGDEPQIEAPWTIMDGAPNAVTSLAFTPGGTPIAFGSSAISGEYYVQRPRPSDGLWERAQGTPSGSVVGRVLRAGDRVYALVQTAVYRLDDETSFTWTPLGNPTSADSGSIQLVTVAPDDTVYAWTSRVETVDGVSTTAMFVLAWRPGQSGFVEVPGGEFRQGIWGAIVDGQGRLVYSTADGFYRGDAAGVSRILDCNIPELTYCEDQISALVSDAAGNLSFYNCPFVRTDRVIYRLPEGGALTKVADIDDAFPYCKSLHGMPDGTLYLVAYEDNLIGAEGALYRLAPGGGALQLIAALEPHYAHVVRDRATVFRYGDGHFAFGVGYRGL
ncbi:MAG TPA: hypothetical protein VIK91_24100 [Nannocystis sp.]